jgi:hypothetical protein
MPLRINNFVVPGYLICYYFSKGEIFWDAQNREHFDYNPGKLVHLDDSPVQDVGIGANILVTVFSFGRQ